MRIFKRAPRLTPEFLGLGQTTSAPVVVAGGGFRSSDYSVLRQSEFEVVLRGQHSSYPLCGRFFPANLDTAVAVISDVTGVPRSSVRLQLAELGLEVGQAEVVYLQAFAKLPVELVVRRKQ